MAQAQARDGAPGAVPTGDMPAAHAPVPVEASASAVPLASFDLTMATPELEQQAAAGYRYRRQPPSNITS